MPREVLRKAWEEHTVVNSFGSQAEEFIRAVRAVNASLGAGRKLRVIGADPPIDWDNVTSRDDHRRWIELRDTARVFTVWTLFDGNVDLPEGVASWPVPSLALTKGTTPGPPASLTNDTLPARVCEDQPFVRSRLERLARFSPAAEVENLRKACGL